MQWLNGYKMKTVLVGCVVAVVLGGGRATADFIWTYKAEMPTPRWDHSSAVVNGKIYVIGGVSSEYGSKLLSTVEEYDPATNTWTDKADIPTARMGTSQSSAVVDGSIYVIGGGDAMLLGLQIVEEYNPATDTWTRKADMSTPRWDPSSAVVNGKIYVIGGAPGSYTGLNVVEQYDPTTDTWTRKADMPLGVWGLCACVVNGKIYAFGGRPGTTAIPNMYEYDPATDTWRRRRDMPVATSNMASVVLDNKIYVIGGWHISTRFPYTTVQLYDPETDIWTQEADVPFRRALFSADVVNNRIYAIGGTDGPHPCPATSTVYEFGPLLDFNGDGIVDSADMCIMVDHWGEDHSLCDIGPTLFGDDIVDVQDLVVLAEHLFEEVNDPAFVAHWALDETGGDIVYDSVGENHAAVLGSAVWQPTGGVVDGALEFDGINDHVSTPFVLNPTDGPFSVFAWIIGGAPDQVILSQENGINWLMADIETGVLRTDISTPIKKTRLGSEGGEPLISPVVITDGNWHRVGFVWDGVNRILYVDDVVVAEDPLPELASASGALHIGTGGNLEEGTFWSGLIDDVRIYDRVVAP
jgi:hypothetical protein